MSLNPAVEIEGEESRYFDTLSQAMQYAITRAVAHRPVQITDVDDKRFVLLRRDDRFGITLTRKV